MLVTTVTAVMMESPVAACVVRANVIEVKGLVDDLLDPEMASAPENLVWRIVSLREAGVHCVIGLRQWDLAVA